jgi:hypothetical protein
MEPSVQSIFAKTDKQREALGRILEKATIRLKINLFIVYTLAQILLLPAFASNPLGRK